MSLSGVENGDIIVLIVRSDRLLCVIHSDYISCPCVVGRFVWRKHSVANGRCCDYSYANCQTNEPLCWFTLKRLRIKSRGLSP